jgi:hypothetical protein
MSETTLFFGLYPGRCRKQRRRRASDDARRWITRALQLDPGLRISNLKDRVSWFRPEDFAKYADALRKAGLPE